MSRTILHRRLKRWLRLAQRPQLTETEICSPQPIPRRHFVKSMGQAALLTLPGVFPTALGNQNLQDKYAAKQVPLAIVGAGLAGLTTAYTLAKAGIHTVIFEGSGRSGGRILTRQKFYQTELFCEEGGEFIDSDHHALQGLATELQIPLQDLRTQDHGLVHEFYFFGGQRFQEKDVIKAFLPLSKILLKDNKALFRHEEYFVPTILDRNDTAIRRLDELSLAQYLEELKAHVDNWVIDLLRVAYIGEYGLDPTEQSALNLLILIEPQVEQGFSIYGESDEGFRLKGGNSRIINTLQSRLKSQDVNIQSEHRLVAIREKSQQINLIFEQDGKTIEHSCKQVIFAMPFSTLRDVDGINKISIPATQRETILGLGYGTNSKVITATTSRFWRESNSPGQASNGCVFTDLPSQSLWDSSRLQNSAAGILTCFLGGTAGRLATPDFYQQVRKDLTQIYPGSQSHMTDTWLLANWSENPFAKGSYSCPKPGQYTSMVGSCSQPKKTDRYLFAGEHCSVDYGGFMNGAVSSGLQVAATLLSGY